MARKHGCHGGKPLFRQRMHAQRLPTEHALLGPAEQQCLGQVRLTAPSWWGTTEFIQIRIQPSKCASLVPRGNEVKTGEDSRRQQS